MRKETITKYEKEFLAWCKGESVILGAPASMHDRTLIWREVREFNDWKPLDTVYVLNDSYSDYRKALAEGKTLQLNEAEKFSDQNRGWVDLSCKSLGISTNLFPVNYYRIKPEEPKFKIGDWTVNKISKQRIIKKVTSVYNDTVTVGDSTVGINVMLIKDLELWLPQPGEWCWCSIFGLVKVVCETTETGKPCYLCWNPWKKIEQKLSNLEPFIGTLPTYLRY